MTDQAADVAEIIKALRNPGPEARRFAEFFNKAATTLERMRSAIEQIKTVCEDNADDSCDHTMALDFVWQVANAALSAPRFKTCDRVRHTMRDEFGTVTVLENGAVKVEFDSATPGGRVSIGEYDEAWFRQHPKVLVACPATASQP